MLQETMPSVGLNHVQIAPVHADHFFMWVIVSARSGSHDGPGRSLNGTTVTASLPIPLTLPGVGFNMFLQESAGTILPRTLSAWWRYIAVRVSEELVPESIKDEII